jgi:hypothetical protein
MSESKRGFNLNIGTLPNGKSIDIYTKNKQLSINEHALTRLNPPQYEFKKMTK